RAVLELDHRVLPLAGQALEVVALAAHERSLHEVVLDPHVVERLLDAPARVALDLHEHVRTAVELDRHLALLRYRPQPPTILRGVRAVLLDSAGRPGLAEVPEPDGPGALVHVRACGLCGSDVEKLGRAAAGAVLGHEVAGELENGGRVTVMHRVPCGTCERCLAGHQSTCGAFGELRIAPGGFAERLRATH